MSSHNSSTHLIAGGVAGTMGAVVTCPLEVVKTRLQSSVASFERPAASVVVSGAKLRNKAVNAAVQADGGSSSYCANSVNQNHNQQQTSASAQRPAARYYTLVTSLGPYARSSNGAGSLAEDSAFDSHATSLNQRHQATGAHATTSELSQRCAGADSERRRGFFFKRAATIRDAPSLWGCLKFIVETEGYRGLFKGIGPNIVGVAPSRAIYFWAYSRTKYTLNDLFRPESPIVHILAAGCAGFFSSTFTNPIWMVKTRLQLDQRRDEGRLTVRTCVSKIYRTSGLRGFYKGISASYFGISETVIHFVIYEALKAQLLQRRQLQQQQSAAVHHRQQRKVTQRDSYDFLMFMMSASCSKATAATITYPHEVARTRLREEGDKYRSLIQTVTTVAREEGFLGLYRGLGTHLVRQIPNTAITMVVYEAVVYAMTRATIDKIDED